MINSGKAGDRRGFLCEVTPCGGARSVVRQRADSKAGSNCLAKHLAAVCLCGNQATGSLIPEYPPHRSGIETIRLLNYESVPIEITKGFRSAEAFQISF